MKTAERIAKVETEVKNLKEYNSKEHAEIKDMIKGFIESADSKYAGKWIEKLNYATIILFLSAIITKIVGFW